MRLMSLAELRSVEMMERGMRYDAEQEVIHVSYPFRDCAEVQPDNFWQARKIQTNIEA